MIKKTLLFLLVICFHNCEQLIEVEDISNETLTILAPSDNITVDTTTINFSWQVLDYAETYHLQIAKPNFDVTQEIIEDTLISSTNFIKSLSSGNYQWRIKAKNFGYETQYTTQNLTIED